jgi:hypothetical protein
MKNSDPSLMTERSAPDAASKVRNVTKLKPAKTVTTKTATMKRRALKPKRPGFPPRPQ